MPPDRPEVGTPADWLRYARSDLALAHVQRPAEVLLDSLCFHAQQAVEKSLKAVLLLQGIRFPYTHDIARLITRLSCCAGEGNFLRKKTLTDPESARAQQD